MCGKQKKKKSAKNVYALSKILHLCLSFHNKCRQSDYICAEYIWVHRTGSVQYFIPNGEMRENQYNPCNEAREFFKLKEWYTRLILRTDLILCQ